MALILRSTIPKALVVISIKSNKSTKLSNLSNLSKLTIMPSVIPEIVNENVYEYCCSNILESCENKPFIENELTPKGHLTYSTRNINEIVERMQKDYELTSKFLGNKQERIVECCKECGNC